MKYLWIGMCTDAVLKEQIVSNNGKLLSSSVSQDNLLEGLDKFVCCDSINSIRLDAYPTYKELKIKEYRWSCW